MLYEKLNEEMQQTVDQFVGRIRGLPWRRRSDLLAEASGTFANEDEFSDQQAVLAAKGFLTAVLERLEDDKVNDPLQAVLFSASLNPEHQAEAARYLADNPDLQEVLEEGGKPEDDPDGGPLM